MLDIFSTNFSVILCCHLYIRDLISYGSLEILETDPLHELIFSCRGSVSSGLADVLNYGVSLVTIFCCLRSACFNCCTACFDSLSTRWRSTSQSMIVPRRLPIW